MIGNDSVIDMSVYSEITNSGPHFYINLKLCDLQLLL
jgi:hypothetical protein